MGLENILMEFDKVEVLNEVLDQKDHTFLEGIERHYEAVHKDALNVLDRYEMLSMGVHSDRESAEHDVNSNMLFNTDLMAQEVHTFISVNHSRMVGDVVHYLAEKYGFNEHLWRSKITIDTWSYMDIAEALLKESNFHSFSEMGWDAFKGLLESRVFKTNYRNEKQYSIKGNKVVFYSFGIDARGWEMKEFTKYSNDNYQRLLKAISYFEKDLNPTFFQDSHAELNDELFQFFPKEGADLKSFYKAKTSSDGHSNTIESFKLYQNERFDLTFFTEEKAKSFVSLFTE